MFNDDGNTRNSVAMVTICVYTNCCALLEKKISIEVSEMNQFVEAIL